MPLAGRVFRLSCFVSLLFAVVPCVSAAPTITSIQNAASNITPGLPNAPLAQGAIFIIKGSGLGPANISFAPAAFQSTSLSGTSVTITAGTTTVNALMYYTSDGQVAALLPSNTPAGGSSFTVTYNGQTSNSMGHTITTNNLGIFTVDSSGQGPGIVTYADYSLVSAAKAANCGGPNTTCGAANPGDALILWGTGLGPVSGDDASGSGLGQNMPNLPLTVWLGGVQAPVIYQGRSGCCIGEDQIVFTVPAGVPTGCAVPLLVQIANTISNNTVMPVANGSRNCTPTNAALATLNVEQAVTAGPLSIADIDLEKGFNDSGNGYQDRGYFQFIKTLGYNPGSQPFFASYVDELPPGTCIVYNNLNPQNNVPVAGIAALDGGSSVTIKGPNGSATLTGNSKNLSTINAAGTFLVPGSFTVTGTGGADVGPFSATITIPPLPALVSPVFNNLVVTRSNGMTVTWTGGGGNVQMYVSSATDNTGNNGSTAVCNAPASAGTFNIPPYIMLALPANNFGSFFLGIAESDVAFTATGLTLGTFHSQSVGPGGFLMFK